MNTSGSMFEPRAIITTRYIAAMLATVALVIVTAFLFVQHQFSKQIPVVGSWEAVRLDLNQAQAHAKPFSSLRDMSNVNSDGLVVKGYETSIRSLCEELSNSQFDERWPLTIAVQDHAGDWQIAAPKHDAKEACQTVKENEKKFEQVKVVADKPLPGVGTWAPAAYLVSNREPIFASRRR